LDEFCAVRGGGDALERRLPSGVVILCVNQAAQAALHHQIGPGVQRGIRRISVIESRKPRRRRRPARSPLPNRARADAITDLRDHGLT